MSSNSDVKTAAALPIPVYIISDTPYGKACLAVYSAYISRGAPTLGTRVRWRQRPAFSHPPTPFGCPSPLRGLEAATSPSREHACEIPSRLLRHLECIPRFTKGESHSRFGDPATLAPPLAALASPKSAGGSSDRQVAPAQASGLEISTKLDAKVSQKDAYEYAVLGIKSPATLIGNHDLKQTLPKYRHIDRGEMVVRKHIREIKLTPSQSDRAIKVKVLVDNNVVHELTAVQEGKTLVWKDLMLPCDLRKDSTIVFRITKIHKFTKDQVSLITYPASKLIESGALSIECDNKGFRVSAILSSESDAQQAYTLALNKAQQLEKRPSRFSTSGQLGSAFKNLLALGSALSELDPTGGARVAFSICTMAWEHLEKQEQQNESLNDLVDQLGRITPTITSVKEIADAHLEDTIRAMLNLIEDASLFILNYKSQPAWAHVLHPTLDPGAQERIRGMIDTFGKLRQEFDSRVGSQTLKAAQLAYDQASLEKLGPTVHASFNPNRGCIEGTRVRAIEDIMNWSLDFKSNQKLLWIYGFAGLGKSAIATSVCELLEERNILAASFFCKRDNADLRDARCLLNTIVYGLAMRHKGYKQAVAKAIQEDPQICSTHIQRRYLSLIERPLQGIDNDKEVKELIIVLDALDETTKDEHRSSLLACLRNICDLAPWLKIIITSRPDKDIEDAFKREDKLIARRDIAAENATEDIHTFVQWRMTGIAKAKHRSMWPEDKIQNLVTCANGLFVWAETACKFIEAGFRADARLEQVLQMRHLTGEVNPFVGLDELYKTSIGAVLKDDGEDNKTIVRLCIGAIVVTSTRTPLPIRDLEKLLSTQIEPGILRTIVKSLSSVIYEHGGPGGPVRVFHPSFEDYITDQTRSSEYYVDTTLYNTTIAALASMLGLQNLTGNSAMDESYSEYANDVYRFVLSFYDAVALSTPHLYLSALSFTPRSSELKRLMFPLFPNSFSLVHGIEEEWTSCLRSISHPFPVLSAALSPDSRRIASVCGDSLVRIWDAESGIAVMSLGGHDNALIRVAYSPDGQRIASSSYETAIRIWNLETGSEACGPLLGHLEYVLSLAFSPNGSRLASGSLDHTVLVWDLQAGTCVLTLDRHSELITSVAFSPDGGCIASGSHDNSVIIWNAETGHPMQEPITEVDIICSVTFSPDSSLIAYGTSEGELVVIETRSGSRKMELLYGHAIMIESIAFSPDGRCIVSGSSDGAVRIWDISSGHEVGSSMRMHSNRVSSVVYSFDGRRVVSCSVDKTVRIWDIKTDTNVSVAPLKSRPSQIHCVAVSHDGRLLATGSADNQVRIWDALTGVVVSEMPQGHSDKVMCVAFSFSGRLLVSGSADNSIRIWDLTTNATIFGPFYGHSDHIRSVVFSPDDSFVASGSADHTIRVRGTETGNELFGPLTGHVNCVRSVDFSPDGSTIISGSEDGSIRIWDAKTGTLSRGPLYGHQDGVMSVASFSDGKYIASCSQDSTVKLWDSSSGDVIRDLAQTYPNEFLLAIALAPNGRYVVCGSSDQTLRVWDLDSSDDTSNTLYGHSDIVNAVAFFPNDLRVVSGSNDGTLRLWDISKAWAPNDSQSPLDDIDDLKTLEISELAHRASPDGWVKSSKGELLLWLPVQYRDLDDSFLCATPEGIRPRATIDFSHFVHGRNWASVMAVE
ncbi:WD40 repeat protein [Ceratobasidium sp. AG-Ba]|nr:WD40 repeat protein [Ceratobasidium sp. AG-Ba]